MGKNAPVPPPTAPTGVAATAGNALVSLSWTASAGATSYSIYQGTAAGGEAATPVKTGISGNSTIITGLTNGATYFFKVAALNGGSASPLSAEVSAKPLAPPLAPTGLTATPGSGKVTLSWGASTGATSYNIYMGTTAGGEAATPVKSGSAVRTVAISGLTNGTTYFFKVAAVNSGGTSPRSAEVSAAPH